MFGLMAQTHSKKAHSEVTVLFGKNYKNDQF
jgi:hypothetical protein